MSSRKRLTILALAAFTSLGALSLLASPAGAAKKRSICNENKRCDGTGCVFNLGTYCQQTGENPPRCQTFYDQGDCLDS
jgi:hypothetical protein